MTLDQIEVLEDHADLRAASDIDALPAMSQKPGVAYRHHAFRDGYTHEGVLVGHPAGGDVVHHAQHAGGCLGGAAHVRRAHREAVHGAVVPRRQVHGRGHVFRQHGAEGIQQRPLLRVQRAYAAEDGLQRLRARQPVRRALTRHRPLPR